MLGCGFQFSIRQSGKVALEQRHKVRVRALQVYGRRASQAEERASGKALGWLFLSEVGAG